METKNIRKLVRKVFYLPKKAAVTIVAAATPYIMLFKMAFWPQSTTIHRYPQKKIIEATPKRHLNCCR